MLVLSAVGGPPLFHQAQFPAGRLPGGRAAGSLAWAGLGNTYFWIDPKRRVAGVILMQLLPFADGPSLAEFADFESAVYKAAQAV